jgi:hypothetical protein
MRWSPFSSSSRRKGQLDLTNIGVVEVFTYRGPRTALIVWRRFSAWSNTMLLGD